MLNEIALSGAATTGVGDEPTHAVQLLIAREHKVALAGLAPFVVFFFDFVHELSDNVEHTVASPRLFPQIGGSVACACGRHGRIACAAEFALIEWEESRPGAIELRGHVRQLRVHREVREAAAVGE